MASSNPAFVAGGDPEKPSPINQASKLPEFNPAKKPLRDKWGKDIEFLLSCIALSVGLGNVWRFPFTALENGGGAFVIPYLIVLFLVGRPIYYLEMLICQFSSRGCINVYDAVPAMRGIGYGQVYSTGVVMAFYASLLGITTRYLVASFGNPLPWSVCQDSWDGNCIDSGLVVFEGAGANATMVVSAELYFVLVVQIRLLDNILKISIFQQGSFERCRLP